MVDLKYFRFSGLFRGGEWLMPAYVGVDDVGAIRYISSDPPQTSAAVETVQGFALPGFQNAHSHAFQYAMTGDAEVHISRDDDFWSWREAMYRYALSVNPEQAEAIAAMLYAEMLRNGYTHVAEFHYLHHDKDGKPYSNLSEMGERMVSAAKTAGIKITLIPVFYQKGGFNMPPTERQRRFISKTSDEFLKLLYANWRSCEYYANAHTGASVHSLRAVDGEDIKRTVKQTASNITPFHIHVAEQKKEVSDCLNFTGQRPMQWLLANVPVDENFHLVHSTHLDDTELKELASSKANVVLCPSTEGNLGDGIFRMKEYGQMGGNWCIGTDSHIGLDPLEEFRMIDYRQRLVSNVRSTFFGDAAGYLLNFAQKRGRWAMGEGWFENYFEVGRDFDAVVYNARSPRLSTAEKKNLSSVLLYHGNSSMAMGTIVNGRWVVKNQKHMAFESIRKQFVKAMKEINT
ncbi:MAG TPA: formimidoylglutamate deiminase [Cyclobacteriaceae bacterium]|nr:formimidoylglutamate deiminase [Cyclobacteriaceae bacterium]